jgi:hypothetical protein
MTYQHEFVIRLNAEHEKDLEFTVYAAVQPNRWVSESTQLPMHH